MDNPCPLVNIREPAQDTEGSVDQVEILRDGPPRVVNICLNKIDFCSGMAGDSVGAPE